MLPDRRPEAFPGKKWPIRVAWYIQVAQLGNDDAGHVLYRDIQSLSYIGKPNRYRALEARAFLQRAKRPRTFILNMFQALFDRAGLVAYNLQKMNKARIVVASGAFTAYYPHSSQAEILETLVKPLYLKRIGGMRLFSQKKTLKVEELEAYYEWYQKQFKRRLRRPKPVALAVIAGEIVGPEQESLPEVETE